MVNKAFKWRSNTIKRLTVPSRGLFGRKDSVPKDCAEKESKYLVRTESPLPVVIKKGSGSSVFDASGKQYLDFVAGHGAVTLGHSNKKIAKEMEKMLACIQLTGRSITNPYLTKFAEAICTVFSYDKFLPLVTGNEAVECSIKAARKWGYLVKKICENEAVVVVPECGFWGSSIAALSTSTDPNHYEKFGPYLKGFVLVPFDDVDALEKALKNDKVCAFLSEPILKAGGVIVPSDRYLKEVRRLCCENNVLWIADEVSTGMGRTGAWIACDHECVRPDLVCLGKGLTGGFYPLSGVLGNNDVLCVMNEGSQVTTFGGSPMGATVAQLVMKTINDENILVNAAVQGEKFRSELICRLPKDRVPSIRGRGLLNAIEIGSNYASSSEFIKKLANNGVLAHSENMTNAVVFTPPLNVTEKEIITAVEAISKTVFELKCNTETSK